MKSSAAAPRPRAFATKSVSRGGPKGAGDSRANTHESLWTVSGEKAGRQTAMYSAPPGSGVL